ncbi:MAG TPA: hypothetical protein VHM19_03405, partial [Polyangiales bacterium]|nr:hypothetical protein [Polyangiales bacterium]
MPEPESPKRRSWTEPLLPKRLANAPAWQAAAAFGCGVLALSLLARLGMAALAVREHYLSGLGPAAVLWVGPTLGHDLLGALLVALPVFLALRFLPASARIARGGALALGYTLLLFTSLLCLVSVGTYGALHSTLHWTQILLAGGARDIFESGMDIVSKPGLAA